MSFSTRATTFDECTLQTCPIEYSVYGYRPSLAASGALIGLYAICMGIQLALGIRYRTWWFATCMVLGCLVEILGYAGRILYYQDPFGQGGFIMQIVLITIGPVFFSGAIYVLMTKIVNYVSPAHSRFNPRFYVYIFLSADILCLILQAVGGAMSSINGGKNARGTQIGVDISLAGLALQVAGLASFLILAIDYYIRCAPVRREISYPAVFKIFCVALVAATVFILVRCSYRVYELAGGYIRTNSALRDESLFIGLESVMVILAAYTLIIAHPGPVFSEHGKTVTESKA